MIDGGSRLKCQVSFEEWDSEAAHNRGTAPCVFGQIKRSTEKIVVNMEQSPEGSGRHKGQANKKAWS